MVITSNGFLGWAFVRLLSGHNKFQLLYPHCLMTRITITVIIVLLLKIPLINGIVLDEMQRQAQDSQCTEIRIIKQLHSSSFPPSPPDLHLNLSSRNASMRRRCILLGASHRAPLVSIGFLCKYSASHRKLQSQINGFRAKCLRKGNSNNGVNNMLVDCTKSGMNCWVDDPGHRIRESRPPALFYHPNPIRCYYCGGCKNRAIVDEAEKSPTRHYSFE